MQVRRIRSSGSFCVREQPRVGLVSGIPGAVLARGEDDRVVVHTLDGDDHLAGSRVAILISIGIREGLGQGIAGVQRPDSVLGVVQGIGVRAVVVLDHGAVLGGLRTPGEGMGAVAQGAVSQSVAAGGSRHTILRHGMREVLHRGSAVGAVDGDGQRAGVGIAVLIREGVSEGLGQGITIAQSVHGGVGAVQGIAVSAAVVLGDGAVLGALTVDPGEGVLLEGAVTQGHVVGHHIAGGRRRGAFGDGVGGVTDDRSVIFAVDGDGDGTRVGLVVRVGVGEGENGLSQGLAITQRPHGGIGAVQGIAVSAVVVLGDRAILGGLRTPGEGMGAVAQSAAGQSIAAGGDRATVGHVVGEVVHHGDQVIQRHVGDGGLARGDRGICGGQVNIFVGFVLYAALVEGQEGGVAVRRDSGSVQRHIQILHGEVVGELGLAHGLLSGVPLLNGLHQTQEPVGVVEVSVAGCQIAARASLEDHGVLNGLGGNDHAVVAGDVLEAVRRRQGLIDCLAIDCHADNLIALVDGPGHGLAVALVDRHRGGGDGAAGLVGAILRHHGAGHRVGLHGVIDVQGPVPFIAVGISVIAVGVVTVVDIVAVHGAIGQALVDLVGHVDSRGVLRQGHGLLRMEDSRGALQVVADSQRIGVQIPQLGNEGHIVSRHRAGQGDIPAGKDLARGDLIGSGCVAVAGAQIFAILHVGIGLDRGVANLVIDVVFVDGVVAGDDHIIVGHGVRQTGPLAEGVSFLRHVIADEAQAGAVRHILDHRILAIREVVAGNLIGDLVGIDGEGAVDDHVRVGHGGGQILIPAAEGVTLGSGVIAPVAGTQVGAILHLGMGLDHLAVHLINNIVLVDSAGSLQDHSLGGHLEAAAADGRVGGGPVGDGVAGLDGLGGHGDGGIDPLVAVVSVGVVDLAVQLVDDLVLGLCPLGDQDVVSLVGVVHLDRVAGLHDGAGALDLPAGEREVLPCRLIASHLTLPVDDQAGDGLRCLAADGTAVEVIGDLGGALDIAPLGVEGDAAHGYHDQAAGIVSIAAAVALSIPAHEGLLLAGNIVTIRAGQAVSRHNLGLGADGIVRAVLRDLAASAVGIIGHPITLGASVGRLQVGVFRDLSVEVEGSLLTVLHLHPSREFKSLVRRYLRRFHFGTVPDVLNDRRFFLAVHSAVIAWIKGHGKLFRAPATIVHHVLGGHGQRRGGEVNRLALAAGVIIPSLEGVDLTGDRVCPDVAHLVAGGRSSPQAVFIQNRTASNGCAVLRIKVQLIAVAGVVQLCRVGFIISFTTLTEAGNLTIPLRKTSDGEIVLVIGQTNAFSTINRSGMIHIVLDTLISNDSRAVRSRAVQRLQAIVPSMLISAPLNSRHRDIRARHLLEERIIILGRTGVPNIPLIEKVFYTAIFPS